MSLTHAILGALNVEPMNGYELAQCFETAMGWVWSAPKSQIYPTLRKMEGAGLIEVESQIRGTKLERRVYSVTPEGIAELRRWAAEPFDTTMKRDPVLLQALFVDMVDPDDAAKVFEHIIDEQREVIEYGERQVREIHERELPIVLQRLSRRPKEDWDYVSAMKAHAFAGAVAVAKARVEWAQEGLRLLAEASRANKARARRKQRAAKRTPA